MSVVAATPLASVLTTPALSEPAVLVNVTGMQRHQAAVHIEDRRRNRRRAAERRNGGRRRVDDHLLYRCGADEDLQAVRARRRAAGKSR